MYTAEMATTAAAKGAAWMDEHCPGWILEIDLGKLDLQYGDVCVLGQTAHCVTHGRVRSGNLGSYHAVVRDVTGEENDYTDEAVAWTTEHGFYLEDDDVDVHAPLYEMLTIAWKEEIRKRL